MKNLKIFGISLSLLGGICFAGYQPAKAQGCIVCGSSVNNAAMIIEEDACYCVNFGSACAFEVNPDCTPKNP